jgi:hypothetical protein
MDEKIRHLIEQHHAYYEVTPSYIMIDEGYGTPAAKTRRIQHGFDVDVYGIKTSDDHGMPAMSPDYALGDALLQELARTVSSDSTDKCSIEVTPFGSTEYLDTKDHFRATAMLQIRISHHRGLDQPAGPAEQRALEEIEKHLQGLGVTRK